MDYYINSLIKTKLPLKICIFYGKYLRIISCFKKLTLKKGLRQKKWYPANRSGTYYTNYITWEMNNLVSHGKIVT